jgi:uncharacterized protein (TIGR02757 family)
MNPCITRSRLHTLYSKYNRREYVHPDPLEFLYDYPKLEDREIVGLIASSLAYGGVKQILKTVSSVLAVTGSPRSFLMDSHLNSLKSRFVGFKHRFTTGEELALMLWGVRQVIERHGSLHTCFLAGHRPTHESIVPALSAFVKELSSVFPERPRSLLPSPDLGSACKRLNLFLRWMVRQDDVDPGGWTGVDPAKLIVPVDVHMHRISLKLGLTQRKQANLKAACEITDAFRQFEPEDPVRYDFALTRFGIRNDLDFCEVMDEG